jgi:beta-lactamase regulating signal transducer with metallopeptidase domain
MFILIGIALKSLLIAGVALGLLQLMKARSAAERSWIAHTGLLALVLLAVAPLVLPSWTVETPALTSPAPAFEAPVQARAPAATTPAAPATTQPLSVAKATPARPTISATAAAMAVYALPAAILLFITFVALARLIALRARADVLVDGHWLSALARAQRRMGFKHGTALLTSDDLASPISWGLLRPVILLNSRAVEASGEAEAIIAHELAHVARMDWAKLLLARIATALFWFNPLVWMLAREAHQLREEAADDAVLAADIADTEYAQLLVGVARHECPGLLLGAHGVAPSKSSLARRVARVLDGKTVRGPAARSFAAGVFVGAVAVAAPLAALTLTPASPKATKAPAAHGSSPAVDTSKPYYAAAEVPTDLPQIIAQGVSTAVTAAVDPGSAAEARRDVLEAAADARRDALEAAADARRDAIESALDAAERAREAATDSRKRHGSAAAKAAIGVTPEYIGAMRAAAPHLRSQDPDIYVSMRSVGVTPEFARDLLNAGFPRLSPDQIVEARAVGLTGSYVRSLRAAGVRGSFDQFIQLRAVGVTPQFAQRVRNAGYRSINADDLVELQALGGPPPRPNGAPPGWVPGADPPGVPDR